MIELNISLFYVLYGLLVLVGASLMAIAIMCANDRMIPMNMFLPACAVFLLLANACISYPAHSVEYQNGYNDYPDNSTYSGAKIISEDSIFQNSYSYYCQGWEAAREDAVAQNEMTDSDKDAIKRAIYGGINSTN